MQFRNLKDLAGWLCSNYLKCSEHYISSVATLLDQQSAQRKKVKKSNVHIYYSYVSCKKCSDHLDLLLLHVKDDKNDHYALKASTGCYSITKYHGKRYLQQV